MKALSHVFIMFILTCITSEVKACTSFCLKSNGNIYLSKNLDWPIDNGYLFLNERGIKKSLLGTSIINLNEFQWISRYRSITFNQFGKEFPLGGMNEKGLAMEELNMQAPTGINDQQKTPINEFQVIQYILDNFESVSEIKENLDKFQCNPLIQYMHYMITDRSGDILIIENNGSGFDFYYPKLTGFSVLSNNIYEESVKYCSNFRDFGGHLPILNRKGSNERFVFAAKMIADFSNQEPIEYSFMILDSIKQDDTRWSLVYDVNNLSITVKFHSCKNVKEFNFRKILDLDIISTYGGDLSDCNFINNNGLSEISAEENTALIKKVFSGLFEFDQKGIDYDLLYKLAITGSRELKCTSPENLVEQLNQLIIDLPETSPLEYPDEIFTNVLNWEQYKVIGLGEATHGTKEFCEMKHRLFRFLVENYDYKVLAFEFSFRKSLKVNDFVLFGIGNIDSLFSDELWIQNNYEVKNLIHWMKKYNQDKLPDEKIYFIGIDNQLDALSPGETIEYLIGNYPQLLNVNSKLVAQIRQLPTSPYNEMTEEEYLFRKELFQKLKNTILINSNLNNKTLTNYTTFCINQLSQSLINSHEFLYRINKDKKNLRDKQLAGNALLICKGPNKDHGVVVWAHNAHIANNPDYYGRGKPAMGKYLKDALGDEYLSVATSFSKGQFKAVTLNKAGEDTDPLSCQIDTEPPCVSANSILNKAGNANYILKINDIKAESKLFNYLNTKKPFIGIGDLYLGSPEKHFFNDRIINLIESYDLLFYFRNTSPINICLVENVSY